MTYDYLGAYGKLAYEDYGHFILYRLIKENGAWRIDDMAIGGNEHREETDLQIYKSLREELRREIAAEQKERKQRGVPAPPR